MPARILSKVLFALLIAMLLITVVAGLTALLAPMFGESLITTWVVSALTSTTQQTTHSIGTGQITLDQGQLIFQSDSGLWALTKFLEVCVNGAIWVMILWLLRQTVEQARSGRPFDDLSVKRLRMLSGLLVLAPVVLIIAQLAWLAILVPGDQLHIASSLLPYMVVDSPTLGALRVHLDFELGSWLAALFVWVLAEVFRYGHQLQQDSDEIV